jgi:hypothetical protein
VLALLFAITLAPVEPAPPFSAWLPEGTANVRAGPRPDAEIVGELRRGDSVTVTGCVPDCDAKDAWALLGEAGAVRLSLLRRGPVDPDAAAVSGKASFAYARVKAGGAEVRERPDPDAPVLRRQKARDVLAVVGGDAAWASLAYGGFLERSKLQPVEAVLQEGVHAPPPAVAIVVRQARVQPDERGPGVGEPLRRGTALPALGLTSRGRVRVAGGTVPRGSVRLAFRRPRPLGVGPSDKWVHIDLGEQVLGAYEGDRLVFAAAISTGKRGWETREGLFRVWRKVAHATMHGERERYYVEEVPYTLFFHGEEALHAAFWHGAFGSAVTHGCVNLSPPDAKWLFEWSPPPLPDGWHVVVPGPKQATLVVLIEDEAELLF